MKKIVMVQLLKGTKEKIVRPEKKEVKPLGRRCGIRIHGLLIPNQARYQTALISDSVFPIKERLDLTRRVRTYLSSAYKADARTICARARKNKTTSIIY